MKKQFFTHDPTRPTPFYQCNESQLWIWDRDIPKELRKLPQWVIWRYAKCQNRWAKIPFQPFPLFEPAKSDQPETWGDFDAAVLYLNWEKDDGIGLMMREENGIVAIDLDKCREVSTGFVENWAEATIRSIDSYTEISPSGTGIRIFAKGKLNEKLVGGLGTAQGKKIENPTREIYWGKHYLTVTGHYLPGYETLQERNNEISQWFKENYPRPQPQNEPNVSGSSAVLSDEKVLEIAFRAKDGTQTAAWFNGGAGEGADHSSIDLRFLTRMAFYTQDEAQLDRILRASKLYREKWERKDYRDATIKKAILGRTGTYTGKKKGN